MKEQTKRHRYSLLASLFAGLLALPVVWYVLMPLVYLADLKILWASFPWFTWYRAYWNFSYALLSYGFFIPVFIVFVLTFFLIRRLLTLIVPAWRKPRSERPAAWLGMLVRFFLTILVVGAFAILWLDWQNKEYLHHEPWFPIGGGLLKENCTHCHNPYRAFHYVKEPEQWRVTVNRMRNLEGAPVSEEKAERIIHYIQKKSSYSDAYLFRAKCLRCHSRGRIAVTPRTADEWRLIIDRAQRHSPYAFRTEWKRKIEQYSERMLAAPLAASENQEREALETKILFERTCGACHRLNLVQTASGSQADISEVIRRMETKAPARFAEVDQERLATFVIGLDKAPDVFNHQFPHDQKVEAAW